MTTTRSRHAAGDEGSLALELAILTPVLLLLLGLVVYAGRMTGAHGGVEGASHDAARAASISRSSAAAQSQAQSTAAASLSAQGLHCNTLDVVVDDHEFARSIGDPASVAVRVTCVVRLSDLGLPGVPGSRTVSATYTSPIDPYRQRTG